MPTLRVALAQFDFPVGAVIRNADQIRALLAEARDQHGADLIVFPELALCGYPPEDLLLRPSFLAACEEELTRLATTVTGISALVGWPQSAGSIVYNAVSLLSDGQIMATYRKRELPNTRARPLARDTATLIRFNENRKSMPRGVSSTEDAVIDTRQTGAS